MLLVIDKAVIQKLIDSDVTAYEIEQATRISRMTSGYRNKKAILEKMHLGSAEKLYQFALEKEWVK